jgi:NAD(P)H-nitrite reductase large subunit
MQLNEENQSVKSIETYVIVGNGAAGYYAAGSIRKNNPSGRIIMISEENVITYYRPQLSDYLTEELQDKRFYVSPESWYADNNIELKLGASVSNIDYSHKKVQLSEGQEISYDKLILANGSNNFIPPVKGRELQGVYTLKFKKDADELKTAMKNATHAVVIGGGLLGLEAAWEMKNSGLQVTVVEFIPRLLPRQLDDEGAEIFKAIADNSGLELILGDSAEEILSSESSKVSGIRLKSGRIIETDLVLFSIGIRPNKALAEKCGIKCDKGIVVNENMETSIKDIYACGDVAEFSGRIYGTWPAAMEMGKVAGKNASGDTAVMKDLIPSVIFKALNAEIFSAGAIDFNDPTLEILGAKDEASGIYKKLFFKNDKLVAAILMGSTSKASKVLAALRVGKSKAEIAADNIL